MRPQVNFGIIQCEERLEGFPVALVSEEVETAGNRQSSHAPGLRETVVQRLRVDFDVGLRVLVRSGQRAICDGHGDGFIQIRDTHVERTQPTEQDLWIPAAHTSRPTLKGVGQLREMYYRGNVIRHEAEPGI